MARVTLLAVLAVLLVVHLPGASPQPVQDRWGRWKTHQHQGNGTLGAVASESAICSRIGTDMLQQGGNAADAVSSPLSPRGV